MDYVVKYRSEGLLSGKEPGDKVTITDSLDAGKLLGLGLIEEVKVSAKAEAETDDSKPATKPAPKPATKPAPKPAAKAATK